MRKKLPAARALRGLQPAAKPHWRASALVLATAVLLGLPGGDAKALALGRITVQSALGEPLRAEIDIPEINAEELATLRTNVAAPDAFRAAGLEYNQMLSGIRITMQRRADGRPFLQLSSPRAVNDPFLDLILETTWSSGRIVRDYTMLFDPPNMRPAAPPVAAQVSPAPPPRAVQAPSPAASRAQPARLPAQPAAGQRSAARTPAGDARQIKVQSGDTAGKIAAAHKPPNVSLDQMLVAMLRSNPEAFIGGNVNRLRSGAVLEIPGPEQAQAISPGAASQTVIAQSRDFNEFRRRLADTLPTTRIGAADRQAAGKVQAQVEDKKAGAASPDKLTLSKGAIQDKAAEDKIARDRAARDAATRVAELNKNIADLNKLGATTTGSAPATTPPADASMAKAPAAAAATAAVSIPAVPVAPPTAGPSPAPMPAPAASAAAPLPAAPATAASGAQAAAEAAATSAASSAAAPQPAGPASAADSSASAPLGAASAAPAKPAAVAPAAPAIETSFIDDMLENPIVPATLGGVLALLLGFGFYRAQQRKKSAQVDSSFLESRLQPDSFFGASGGQRIDTNEGAPTGSSMVYSPSQLDAAGDVDPVAEADVYLAYGRDLQAEEILKEAMRTTPQRVAIHSKLLEIYCKRRDAKAFELVATQAFGLTQGEGAEWDHICELGRELDPANTLYRPGGQPGAGAVAAAVAATATNPLATTVAMPATPATDLDLDLDFSIGDDEPAPAAAVAAPQAAAETTQALNVPLPDVGPQPMPSLDMDFDAAEVALPEIAPAVTDAAPASQRSAAQAAESEADADILNFDIDSIDSTPAAAPAQNPAPEPAAASGPDSGMIEFDLDSLSLDLETPPAAAAKPDVPVAAEADDPPSTSALISSGFEVTGSDPLATKLALAQEFNAIGDPDGARSLAQEVLAEASGELKTQAQRFLAEIG